MKIGDFAKACHTNISVLRHYDKRGLLCPVYVDPFTEYRYYDRSQVVVFQRIGELKKAGFTLEEIKHLLYDDDGEHRKKQLKMCFQKIHFWEGGSCTLVYEDETITGDEKQTWTKGYLLRKWNHCACAYEIRRMEGVEYLIIEWKSGDYRFGGRDTDYYVFVREG